MQSSASSLAVDFDCPEEFGYYPHPTDCSQYYVCVFGGALLESCTGGLMYSHELQTCDWPRNVGCDAVTSDRQQHQQYQSSRVQPSRAPAPTQQPIYSRATQPQYQQQQQQRQQPQTQQTQQQPRIRFTTVASSVAPPAPFSPRTVQQPQQLPQRFPPPPPELRIAPNPVVTSRGQPKYVPDEVSFHFERAFSACKWITIMTVD